MRGFNYKKTVQALNYIANQYNGTVNKMKAIKLIWLSDRLHLRNYGRTITGDTYFAFKFGPVPSGTRDILQESDSFIGEEELSYSAEYISIITKLEYSSKKTTVMKVFSETDIEALDEVIKVYGKYTQFELSEISHEFPEWKRWEKAFNQKSGTRFLINIEDFFNSATKEYPLFKEETTNLQLVKDLYLRVDTNSANKQCL